MFPADGPPDLLELLRPPVEIRAASTVPHPAPVLKVATLFGELETGHHADPPSRADVDHDLFSRRIVVTTSARAITADPGAWDVYFRQILGPDGRPDATLFFLA